MFLQVVFPVSVSSPRRVRALLGLRHKNRSVSVSENIMVWLTVPVLVAVITDGDGPTSCATCPFMTLQNALNSPQLTWKWMEMSPGVFRNTQWCDLNCGRPFGGRDGCNNLHLFMGKSANKHLMWRCYDTFGPDVNLRQTLAANIYILESELHHPVVLNFSSCKCSHVKTKERRGKE